MAGGGRAGCKRPLSRVMGRASAAERTGGTQGGCTLARRRRRLPDDALIVLEVGLGLAEEVPVGHRPEIIVPTRWERCEGTANSRAREGSGWSSSGAGLRRAGPPGVGPISPDVPASPAMLRPTQARMPGFRPALPSARRRRTSRCRARRRCPCREVRSRAWRLRKYSAQERKKRTATTQRHRDFAERSLCICST